MGASSRIVRNWSGDGLLSLILVGLRYPFELELIRRVCIFVFDEIRMPIVEIHPDYRVFCICVRFISGPPNCVWAGPLFRHTIDVEPALRAEGACLIPVRDPVCVTVY